MELAMQLVKEGKTKDVYEREDGKYVLYFKDTATGKNGRFDPSENQVGLTIRGLGNVSLRMTEFFFRVLEEKGIRTHMHSVDVNNNIMVVEPVTMFGKGIECICRRYATGSFVRRYGGYIKDGQPLPNLFEVSIKDDERGDPFIGEDSLDILGILKEGEYRLLKEQTQRITDIIADILFRKMRVTFIDHKIEFGKSEGGQILLIDEISPGTMKCCQDGRKLPPEDLARIVLEEN